MGHDRQRAADRPDAAVQRQLTQPGGVARQVAVLAGVDDGRRHRQVESTPLFGQLRRRQVDRHLAPRELKAAVVDGDLHPLAGFLQRPVAEPHDMKPGQAIGDIRLHLDPDAVEPEHRPR